MPPPHPPTYVVQRFESLCSSTFIILSVLAKAANTRVHEVEEIVYSANVAQEPRTQQIYRIPAKKPAKRNLKENARPRWSPVGSAHRGRLRSVRGARGGRSARVFDVLASAQFAPAFVS